MRQHACNRIGTRVAATLALALVAAGASVPEAGSDVRRPTVSTGPDATAKITAVVGSEVGLAISSDGRALGRGSVGFAVTRKRVEGAVVTTIVPQ